MGNSVLNGWKGLFLLLAILTAALFYDISNVPLFDEDEGTYALVSCEMLETGDFLVPRLEGRPFFHKPPLFYWIQASCIRLLGSSEAALRLPSALASFAWALLVFLFVKKRVGPEEAWFTSFFLVTAAQTNLIAKAAIPDALLNLCITATMLAMFEYFNTRRKVYLWVAFGTMGIGFLTKGPIAVAIPAAVGTCYHLFNGHFTRWLKTATDPLGVMIFILIALPWYMVLFSTFGESFFKEFFLIHNLRRFGSAMEGHSGPFFYYIPVILLGLMPYTILLFSTCRNIKNIWAEPLGRYLVLWFLFVLILFSMAGTKLHHYIVYGYVPLLIFMARSLKNARGTYILLVPLLGFILFLAALPAAASLSATFVTDEFAKLVLKSALMEFGTGFYVTVTIAFVCIMGLAFIPGIRVQLKTVVFGLMFTILINGCLIPKVASIMQTPIKSAALLAKNKGYDVVMWRMSYPSFSFYYGRPLLKREPQAGDVIITKADKLNDFPAYTIIYQDHSIVLARIEVLPKS